MFLATFSCFPPLANHINFFASVDKILFFVENCRLGGQQSWEEYGRRGTLSIMEFCLQKREQKLLRGKIVYNVNKPFGVETCLTNF